MAHASKMNIENPKPIILYKEEIVYLPELETKSKIHTARISSIADFRNRKKGSGESSFLDEKFDCVLVHKPYKS